MRHEAWVMERLRWEDWAALLPRLSLFAEKQIRGRQGSETNGRVLAGGHDGDGVASEVIAAVLAGKGRLAIGWTRERLERELKRLVKREVRRLGRRMETRSTVSEWEVLSPDQEGERRSVFEEMIAPEPDGYAEAVQAEEEERRERAKKRIEACVDGDKIARGLLECVWDGVVKRREIAMRLGVDVKAVTAARKRIERAIGKGKCEE